MSLMGKHKMLTVAEVGKRLILRALFLSDWHRERAASTLGVSFKTVYSRVKTYEAQGVKIPKSKHQGRKKKRAA